MFIAFNWPSQSTWMFRKLVFFLLNFFFFGRQFIPPNLRIFFFFLSICSLDDNLCLLILFSIFFTTMGDWDYREKEKKKFVKKKRKFFFCRWKSEDSITRFLSFLFFFVFCGDRINWMKKFYAKQYISNLTVR